MSVALQFSTPYAMAPDVVTPYVMTPYVMTPDVVTPSAVTPYAPSLGIGAHRPKSETNCVMLNQSRHRPQELVRETNSNN